MKRLWGSLSSIRSLLCPSWGNKRPDGSAAVGSPSLSDGPDVTLQPQLLSLTFTHRRNFEPVPLVLDVLRCLLSLSASS